MDEEDPRPLQFQIPLSYAGGELESLQEPQEEIMNLLGKPCMYIHLQCIISNFYY